MSRGPVLLQPVNCTTLELKDLADLQDFERKGEISAVYGLEYTDTGFYKRKELDEKKVPKLEQLRNVEADVLDNFEYKLVRENNKWHILPIVDWQIHFAFTSPHVLFDKSKNFRKAINAGPHQTSLKPGNNSFWEIGIKPFEKTYLLYRKDSVDKPSITDLQFVPEVETHDSFTMVFDVILKNKEEGVVRSVSEKLIEGLHIAWQDLGGAESQRVTILIGKNSAGDINAVASSDKITISTEKNISRLSYINITHLDLIGFYYTDSLLSSVVLQKIFNI